MYFQQHTLLDFWKICQIYVKQSHLNSYILRFTVHFIPVQYVFHPASAEIEFVKYCAGYAPKKQNTARAAPEDSESLWGRWRRLPVFRGYSWSEPVDSRIHSSEIHSRGKDRGKTAWWPKQRRSWRRNAELPQRNRRRELSAHFVADKPRATKTAAKQAIHTWPYRREDSERHTFPRQSGPTPPSWAKQTGRSREEDGVRKLVHEPWCRSALRFCRWECGYNIWTSRSQGRARQGERAYRQVCGQRGGNVTVALAISPINGLMFHSAIIGGMNAERFSVFLAQARLNLDPNEHVVSFTIEPRYIAVLTSWVLTRSSKCCYLTAHFSISSNRRSARWKRPSRQIFLVQRSKSAWIKMKQEIEGSLWEFTAPSCSSKHWNKTSPQ